MVVPENGHLTTTTCTHVCDNGRALNSTHGVNTSVVDGTHAALCPRAAGVFSFRAAALHALRSSHINLSRKKNKPESRLLCSHASHPHAARQKKVYHSTTILHCTPRKVQTIHSLFGTATTRGQFKSTFRRKVRTARALEIAW